MKINAASRIDSLRELAFDGDFWGYPIAQASHPDVDEWARAHATGCIFLLADTDEPELIQDAERRGFRYMDVRVELERPTMQFLGNFARPAVEADVPQLVELARESHRITRFYADPRFANARCDDLYEAWIRNSLDGWADAVLIHGDHGDPHGYVTVHLDGDDSTLGLIAVQPHQRGRGLGLRLTRAAIHHAAEHGAARMRVTTQARNLSAMRLFQNAGFGARKTAVWLHKWIADE